MSIACSKAAQDSVGAAAATEELDPIAADEPSIVLMHL